MSGILLVIAFLIAIGLLIISISRWKVHPFFAIMAVSLLFGLAVGLPLKDVKGADGNLTTTGLATLIGQGFSGAFTSIGLVIIFGAFIGIVLEATGGAFTLADMVVRLVGKRRPELAMQIMGWVVSIPVFCDSGFVILNPIRRALIQRTAASSVAMSMALSGGLYVAHVFVPPTPGPMAAAANLGIGENLLLVIGLGLAASLIPMIVLAFLAPWLGRRVRAEDDVDATATREIRETYEEIRDSQGKLPSGPLTLAPIVVPIVAMALGSVSAALKWKGTLGEVSAFIGAPIIALGIGVILAVMVLSATGRLRDSGELTEKTLTTVGPILFITAAGGVLGKVISASPLVPFITDNATSLAGFGIFFPFLLSAILKTAQGSSTVALVTTSGIVAPLLPTLGLDTPALAALAVMAIGAGAMTVSHANDSYFWVVTKFGELTTEQGYRTQTLMTAALGASSMVGISLLWLVL